MKYLLLLTLLWNSSPTTYIIDVNKSQVKWTGYAEVGGYAPTGSVALKAATLTFDGEALVSGKVVIDMATLNTPNADMQTHLKAKDFFDVVAYPEASFVLSSVKGNTVIGLMTIKGITERITVPVTIAKNGNAVALTAKFRLDRTKFGIKYNSKSYFQDLGSYAIKDEFALDITVVGVMRP